MTEHVPVTVAYGDGIGPEIMDAVLSILRYVNAPISIEAIEIGEKQYTRGASSGIPDSAWDTIYRNKIFLKAPITTPQGGGYKSLNVTLRGALDLYANVRPCVAYDPYISTHHPDLNVVIVRENTEDLYTGIEYQLNHSTFESLKLITDQGCERIIRYAFEYAVQNNRKKVTCFSKDNIMKMTDGAFHRVFDKVAKEYPKVEADHYIIDIGSARLANQPELFDVIVTSNLYGDIISDIAAEISGSVGLAGSANIGRDYAMFEAIHGSAPDIAGQNCANPSGLLHASIMMLLHIKQPDLAGKIHNAWLRTLEDGIHTADIYDEEISTEKVGTKEFAQAVIDRLGKRPAKMTPVRYNKDTSSTSTAVSDAKQNVSVAKQLVGVDVFIDWSEGSALTLSEKMTKQTNDHTLQLQMITLGGLKVWPGKSADQKEGHLWRLRFVPAGETKEASHADIIALLQVFADQNLDVVKTENLYTYDGEIGFSLAQGE